VTPENNLDFASMGRISFSTLLL